MNIVPWNTCFCRLPLFSPEFFPPPFWNKGKQAASGELLAMSMNDCSSHFFFSTLRVLSPILFRQARGGALKMREGVISEKGLNMRSKTQKALEDKTQAFRLRNTCVRIVRPWSDGSNSLIKIYEICGEHKETLITTSNLSSASFVVYAS